MVVSFLLFIPSFRAYFVLFLLLMLFFTENKYIKQHTQLIEMYDEHK